jgi:hypothetical protein
MVTGIPDPTSTITRILARIAIFYRRALESMERGGCAAVLLSPFSTQTGGEVELLECHVRTVEDTAGQRTADRPCTDDAASLLELEAPLIADSFRITVR